MARDQGRDSDQDRPRFLATAMTGDGAALAGGRWNPAGTRAVSCSSTLSLASLEVLVHTHRLQRLQHLYLAITVEVAEAAIDDLDAATLPSEWRQRPIACAAVGLSWITRASAVALRVPSAVTPSEHNLMLNPEHPRFHLDVQWGDPRPFTFDQRLT